MTATKKSAKKMRIHPEILPATAKYLTLDETEYVMIPVEDFGEWYEDALDAAIAEDRKEDAADGIPWEEAKKMLAEQRRRSKSTNTLASLKRVVKRKPPITNKGRTTHAKRKNPV